MMYLYHVEDEVRGDAFEAVATVQGVWEGGRSPRYKQIIREWFLGGD